MKKKLLIIYIIAGLILITVALLLIKSSLANDNIVSLEDKVVDGVLFKDAKLKYELNTLTLDVEVYNNTNEDISLDHVIVYIKETNGNEFTMIGKLGKVLRSNMGKTMTASIEHELPDILDINYEIIK